MPIVSNIIGLIKSFLRMILVAIGGMVAIVILIPIGMMLIGYRVNADSKELAQEAAKKGNPTLCANIIHYGYLGPSTGESRSHCVYTYAKISKDPAACKLIMPSEYGLDCIGTVTSLLYTGIGCSDYATKDIYCSSGLKGKNIGLETCTKYPEQELKDWCHRERSRILKDIYECDLMSVNPSELRQECEHWHAFKEKDTALCSRIPEGNRRRVCEIKIEAWLKYPELRGN